MFVMDQKWSQFTCNYIYYNNNKTQLLSKKKKKDNQGSDLIMRWGSSVQLLSLV